MYYEHFFTDTDLASRHSAAAVRATIEPRLGSEYVVLDFSRVENVSESYADELIGVLVARHGLASVFAYLQLRGTRPAVAQSIAAAVRHRLSLLTSGDTTLALLAARDALARQRAARAGL